MDGLVGLVEKENPVSSAKAVRRRKRIIPRPITLLQRVFFLNTARTKYVGIALHPESNYEAFIEFGKVNGASVFLTYKEYLTVVEDLDLQVEGYTKRVLLINGMLIMSAKKCSEKLHFCITFSNQTVRLTMDEMQDVRVYKEHWRQLLNKYDESFNAINHYISCVQSNEPYIDMAACLD